MYRIVIVSPDAPEAEEPLGTKPKFWYGGHRYLFKVSRLNTGEDWAEKVCTVERVNLPPAPVQFRVLCSAFMDWPKDFNPLSASEYDPLVTRPNAPEISLPPRYYRT